ncbi:MAG: methyltransferase domain-containing protein [Deltaproteobacteria bacterium]|nr:methyltransferase domain-containing protein [Deltaproteobacteria bacterium]
MDHHDHHSKKFHHLKAELLDRPERRSFIPPDKIVALVAPFAGMRFGDLGCGTGYGTWPIIDAIAGKGRFIGIDSQEEMLAIFRERAAQHAHANSVEAVLTTDESIALPDASLDVLLMIALYHELPDREKTAREIARVLKPGGRVVIIDWRPLRSTKNACTARPPITVFPRKRRWTISPPRA